MSRSHAVVVYFDDPEDAAEFTMTLGLDQRSDARMVSVSELNRWTAGYAAGFGEGKAAAQEAMLSASIEEALFGGE